MENKLTKVLAILVILAIVGSFAAIVYTHVSALSNAEYYKSYAYQENVFISALTLALMIVLIIPYMISNEQIKRNVEEQVKSYWNDNYQKDQKQFISKSEKDYAHLSRMMAYLLNKTKNYYWAMAWAGDSVVAYIRRFKEHPSDFKLNEEYFYFSLYVMRESFSNRKNGTFLEDNIDLESDYTYEKKSFFKKFHPNSSEFKKELIDKELIKKELEKIKNKIFDGESLTQDEKEVKVVKELKRVILRSIKWQCIISIEVQERKLLDEAIKSINWNLDSAFKRKFKEMIHNSLESFYHVGENDGNEEFINDIVRKVEIEEYKEKVRKHLKEILAERHQK